MTTYRNIIPIMCMLGALMASSCSWKNDYFDHAKALKEKALKGTPASPAAFASLIEESSSKDYWTRYYSICFLSELGREDNTTYRAEIISALIKALADPNQAIRRAAVSGIRDIGPAAVDEAAPKLVAIVQSGEEMDVCWFSAEALGASKATRYRASIISALLGAIDRRPVAQYPDGAPHLSHYAIAALVELAKTNPLDIRNELQSRLVAADPDLAVRIKEALTKIDSRPPHGA